MALKPTPLGQFSCGPAEDLYKELIDVNNAFTEKFLHGISLYEDPTEDQQYLCAFDLAMNRYMDNTRHLSEWEISKSMKQVVVNLQMNQYEEVATAIFQWFFEHWTEI